MRTLFMWFRMIFSFWTMRFIRLAPGVWLEVPRSMSDREARRLVANFIYRRGKRS
jgi:hypothetical protein